MHYPVMNKAGDVITAAVTNLDLHDISRAVRTYGVKKFYVITPLSDQRSLVGRIVSHWVQGMGATYNPDRREALERIQVENSIEEVIEKVRTACGERPKTVATSAKKDRRSIGFHDFRKKLESGAPCIITFGTAWGLSEEFISSADYVLEPIKGSTDYNHLSVRSAASIILDRLLGRD
ncbi:MAG TPA: RNA methyltransferase [Deltaproteobacteria bacterium]|nr:RNA methyltransferase [Deltaproteobacteria bacterium]